MTQIFTDNQSDSLYYCYIFRALLEKKVPKVPRLVIIHTHLFIYLLYIFSVASNLHKSAQYMCMFIQYIIYMIYMIYVMHSLNNCKTPISVDSIVAPVGV